MAVEVVDSVGIVEQAGTDTVPGAPLVRAYAPSVEGLQTGSELDLSAVPVPANQGLFLIVEWGPAG